MTIQDELSDEDDWRDPYIAEDGEEKDSFHKSEILGIPNDYWVLPPYCNVVDILGCNQKRLEEISSLTGVNASYDKSLHQVNFWGDLVAIAEAKKSLELVEKRLSDLDILMSRKKKKWSRPSREFTEEEIENEKRRQEEIRYLKEPVDIQPYNAIYYLPPYSITIERLMGPKESFINQIRIDCKTFIKYNPHSHTFQLSSNEEGQVHLAANRLRNWHLRCSRSPEGGTARLIQQPEKNLLLRYQKIPPGFLLSEYTPFETDVVLREKQRVLQKIEAENSDLSKEVQTLDLQNEEEIQRLLILGLESLRLKDWVIRLKIRFGTICLIDFPRKENVDLTIEQVKQKLFTKKKFISALSPCIGIAEQNISSLIKYLKTHGQEFSENPKTSFSIIADQCLAEKKRTDRTWETRTDVSCTSKGEPGLCNTVTQYTNLVDISCFSPEDLYSWDLRLQYARVLPSDNVDALHQVFSSALKLSPSGRLILPSVYNYSPKIVTQKTKWKYNWLDFVVEICKEELWDLEQIKRAENEFALDLSSFNPHRVSYKASMYKESWLNRFADNLHLGIGETPSWTLRDFLTTPKENVRTLVHCAKKFGKVLSREVPLYYNKT